LIDKGIIMSGSFGIFNEIEIFENTLIKKTFSPVRKETLVYNKYT